MMRKTKIDTLMTFFNDEKKFITDGYYRIRTINENTVELAFLVAGSCGETLVHPQITVSLTESPQAIGIKLIDMYSIPPLFLHRNDHTAHEIDTALDHLIEKFSDKTKNTKTN
ncbi:hypothetical protein JZO69_00370 [Enterococcus sp. DIV0869a]|uniref:Uncharacterized protein n=2 Tax=Candidatus Enterococcus ikei TaxID=2815326 RepID=A0ABS3GVJ0_9ENTE|nr:hypothetical protein [Enterococcus sp. DIV0869a]